MADFLPNLFVLGAAKCGTTTLHLHLSDMPEICMSRPKEPFFFECEYERGLKFYRKSYFPHWRGEKMIGESRHRNLYLPYVPERIYQLNPKAKLILILRNPIDRAMSHWRGWYSQGIEKLSFPDAIKEDYQRIKSGLLMATEDEQLRHCDSLYSDGRRTGHGLYRTYLDSGYYYNQLTRYRRLFPSENMLVLLLEDFSREPRQVLEALRSFLALDSQGYEVPEVLRANIGVTRLYRRILHRTARIRRSGLLPRSFKRAVEQLIKRFEPKYELDSKTRAWLQNHYREHNQSLQSFLNRDLSHWK